MQICIIGFFTFYFRMANQNPSRTITIGFTESLSILIPEISKSPKSTVTIFNLAVYLWFVLTHANYTIKVFLLTN